MHYLWQYQEWQAQESQGEGVPFQESYAESEEDRDTSTEYAQTSQEWQCPEITHEISVKQGLPDLLTSTIRQEPWMLQIRRQRQKQGLLL